MKIKRMNATEQYRELKKSSDASGETNDCTVKAVAQVLRISYEKAHALCAAYGRKDRSGMFEDQYHRLLTDQGVELVRIDSRLFIDQYPGVHSGLKNVTTHHPDRFNKVWEDGNRYLFSCNAHVAYVENGKIHDWTRGRAYRVNFIYRIEEA